MRLHRFYIEKINPTITDERLIHQWKNVFRYEAGDKVILFDGSGKDFECEIQGLDKKEASLTILEEKEGIIPKKNIVLYQSLVKKDNMEWIVEKATELGISKIVPIISERSEKKDFNLERAKKIIIEASEQCGRSNIPELGEVTDLDKALEIAEGKLIAFHTATPPNPPLDQGKGNQDLSLFIGPEGGFTENEIEEFKKADTEIRSLGDLVLRAETAAIAALAISTLPD